MIIRWILSVALMYGVYTETGIWTTIAMTFTVIYCEINTWLWEQFKESIK